MREGAKHTGCLSSRWQALPCRPACPHPRRWRQPPRTHPDTSVEGTGAWGLSLPWTRRPLHTSPEPDRAGARGNEPVKPKAPGNKVFLYSARKIKSSWNKENAGGEPGITLNERPPLCRHGAASKAGAGRGAASTGPSSSLGGVVRTGPPPPLD